MKRFVIFTLLIVMGFCLCSCRGVADSGDYSDETTGTDEKSSTESGSEESVRQIEYEAHYVRTEGGYDEKELSFPKVIVIRSRQELEQYYDENSEIFDIKGEFRDICEQYTDEYFKKQILIFVLVEHGSGSIRDEVTEVSLTEDSFMNISIVSHSPYEQTCDMARWHIIIEPQAGVDVNAENIKLNRSTIYVGEGN